MNSFRKEAYVTFLSGIKVDKLNLSPNNNAVTIDLMPILDANHAPHDALCYNKPVIYANAKQRKLIYGKEQFFLEYDREELKLTDLFRFVADTVFIDIATTEQDIQILNHIKLANDVNVNLVCTEIVEPRVRDILTNTLPYFKETDMHYHQVFKNLVNAYHATNKCVNIMNVPYYPEVILQQYAPSDEFSPQQREAILANMKQELLKIAPPATVNCKRPAMKLQTTIYYGKLQK